jgi:hypothetical protein
MPDFHGYGYNSWQTPGSWGGGGTAASRMGMFHSGGSGTVGLFGQPPARPGPGFRVPTPVKSASGGTIGGLKPLGGIEWGKGTAAIGEVLNTKTQRTQAPRQGRFQTAAGERYIGDVTHQPVGALGAGSQPALAPGNQPALGRAYPGAIETTATAGALPAGPIVMPSGPRPAGPAPSPFALPSTAGSPAPGRARGRRQAFGQLQFGAT